MSFDSSILRLMVITGGLDGGMHDPALASDIEDVHSDRRIDTLVAHAKAAERGGATCIQVRLKREPARVVAAVTRRLVAELRIPVLVNDRFDIALAAGAAGVHVGADDIAVSDVRRLTPPGFIIGTSVGCDAEVANAAEADFVGIGPVFTTTSKSDAGVAIGPEEFGRLARATGKPAIAIGGVAADNVAFVIQAGAIGVAAIRAVWRSADPAEAAHALRSAVDAALAVT
jgi:thiamine-phosphate pyrophosphorylase